jgi:hypothetical protein
LRQRVRDILTLTNESSRLLPSSTHHRCSPVSPRSSSAWAVRASLADSDRIYGQALKANATIASTSIGSALTSQCGSSFGSTSKPPHTHTYSRSR